MSPLTPQQIVRQLLEVISRQRPLHDANALLSDKLTAYMDEKPIGNKSSWFKWVQFLHYNADKKIDHIIIEIDDISTQDNRVTVDAHWSGTINGTVHVSTPGKVIYEISEGHIINIWTHRSNYTFIYGERIAQSSLAFYLLLLKLMFFTPPSSTTE